MINDRTPHLNLPLPHLENYLADDVGRIRQIAEMLDQQFQQLDQLLASDDTSLDELQELVTALKDNRVAIQELVSSVAENRDDIFSLLTEQEEVQSLADGQSVVDLAELTGTSGASVYIEGIRLTKNEWTADAEVATRFTLSSTYPAGTVISIVRRQGGA